jgi:formylglycine-generating enzyme required for sulfatase activity
MEFVLVPGGKSWLGGGGGKPGTREVEFTDAFYLGAYEVTQEEWQKVMGTNPSAFGRTRRDRKLVKDVPDADFQRFPVETIRWPDAQEFVRRVNDQVKEAGWAYRLPTVAEWEYACRGGPMADRSDSAFDFYFEKATNRLLPSQANFKHNRSPNRPCKVGSYRPNRLGLYDMHGNVREWCEDEGLAHVLRGGAWSDDAEACRAGNPPTDSPVIHLNVRGLRLARVAAGTESR